MWTRVRKNIQNFASRGISTTAPKVPNEMHQTVRETLVIRNEQNVWNENDATESEAIVKYDREEHVSYREHTEHPGSKGSKGEQGEHNEQGEQGEHNHGSDVQNEIKGQTD